MGTLKFGLLMYLDHMAQKYTMHSCMVVDMARIQNQRPSLHGCYVEDVFVVCASGQRQFLPLLCLNQML